jgi:transcriptional adapter 2-alpha
LQLLTEEEVKLCSELHILPKPYLYIKQSLLREFARCGGRMELEQAVELLPKVDANIVSSIWDHLFGAPESVDLEGDADMLASALEEDSSDTSDDSDSSSEEDEGDLMGELQEAIAQQQQLQLEQANGRSSSEEE